MITLVSMEQIKTVHYDKEVDFDRYNIEVKNQLSTNEYSIIVNFINEEITGDCVAYGSWFAIEKNECLKLLDVILKSNKPFRKFDFI